MFLLDVVKQAVKGSCGNSMVIRDRSFIFISYNKIMVISRMENQYTSQNPAEQIFLSRSGNFSLLTSMKCSFTVVKALKTIGNMSYIHQTWQRTTQLSVVLKNITNCRACLTFKKTGAIEMRMLVVSVAIILSRYYAQITNFFLYILRNNSQK